MGTGALLEIKRVQEGLPKGSPLPPILFNLYVADIPSFEDDKYV